MIHTIINIITAVEIFKALKKIIRHKKMEMVYVKDGKTIKYKIVTNPPDAAYWSTHRLKKSEIKLITKYDRSTAATIRQEILDDIITREPNPTRKLTPPNNPLPKGRKAAKRTHVKTRKTKQKTRR